jgi:hypothetical protein
VSAELNSGANNNPWTSGQPKPKPKATASSGPKKPVVKVAPKRKKSNKPSPLVAGLLVLLLITLGSTLYYMNRYNNAQVRIAKLTNPADVSKAEQQKLIAEISVLTPLPTGEAPTFAEVVDSTKLASQPFFASAQNGDKVLIYTKAKKAILYRPSTNKIINIAPVNFGAGQTTQ